MFEKTQYLIDPSNSIRRQHAIPAEVHRFAAESQLNFEGSRGRGRANVPTLPDIYYALVREGFALVISGTSTPVFKEVGRPEGCTFSQIVFEMEFDQSLRDLKNAIDDEDGLYLIENGASISLISLAVNLIQVAIEARAYKPKRRPGAKRTVRPSKFQ